MNKVVRFFLFGFLLVSNLFINFSSTSSSATLFASNDNTTAYLGRMSPNMCLGHLARYRETKQLYGELSGYLNIIPVSDCSGRRDCNQCPLCHQLVFNRDIISLWNSCMCPVCNKCSKKNTWMHCRGNSCVNSGYFQECNRKYLPFFHHYLQYCSENRECDCYWPEHCGLAAGIHQGAINLGEYLERNYLLSYDFSPYWNEECEKSKSIATYCFFYSQHQQVCSDLEDCISVHEEVEYELREINRTLDKHRIEYLELYEDCLSKHPHPKIYYERGMIHMHWGNTDESLKDMRKMMDMATNDARYKDKYTLTSEMYQQEGAAYSDLRVYDKAIASLTEAINKDPKNFEAYFQRASAYFETGDFDLAIHDYIHSEFKELNSFAHAPLEFTDQFLVSVLKGMEETACEFVPSMCHSIYGLGQCLWAFCDDPLDSTKSFVNASYGIANQVVDYLKTLDENTLKEYAEGFSRFYDKLDNLSNKEKATIVGFAIGKYGTEIYAGAKAIQCVSAYKELRNANRLCNLEAMAYSSTNKEIVSSAALKHYSRKCTFYEKIKLHWGRQDKHIPGTNNYRKKANKSIWEHPDPEGLLKKHAGTGTPKLGEMVEAGYQEAVDFKEYIGMWVSKDGKKSLPTKTGKIHYGKEGAHIVPIHPNTTLW